MSQSLKNFRNEVVLYSRNKDGGGEGEQVGVKEFCFRHVKCQMFIRCLILAVAQIVGQDETCLSDKDELF